MRATQASPPGPDQSGWRYGLSRLTAHSPPARDESGFEAAHSFSTNGVATPQRTWTARDEVLRGPTRTTSAHSPNSPQCTKTMPGGAAFVEAGHAMADKVVVVRMT
ncbi:hypothetical protein GCM10022232_82560 [Streptomyces plumbiresistens]|uniref:Uncharacterized protein n=1 Tax=Streptomyces plumbiresistens TaxID=511811 RepID=A0ABP7TF95_9ACTN